VAVLDTNAAFLPFRERLPLEAEVDRLLPGVELVVPSGVRAELERLVAQGAPHAVAAQQFALRLRSVATRARGDGSVVEAARRSRAAVVTADRELARRARAAGSAVLVPRDRSRLELRAGRPSSPSSGPRRRRSAPKH
jgi:rRNA-processing protein FCF1